MADFFKHLQISDNVLNMQEPESLFLVHKSCCPKDGSGVNFGTCHTTVTGNFIFTIVLKSVES